MKTKRPGSIPRTLRIRVKAVLKILNHLNVQPCCLRDDAHVNPQLIRFGSRLQCLNLLYRKFGILGYLVNRYASR